MPSNERAYARVRSLISRSGLIICAVCWLLLLIGPVWFLRARYVAAQSALMDANAMHQTTDMIELFVIDNGVFPPSWEALRAQYAMTQPGYNSFSFDQLQERVQIDFAASLAEEGEYIRYHNEARHTSGGFATECNRRLHDALVLSAHPAQREHAEK